jgi:hypothetical protein
MIFKVGQTIEVIGTGCGYEKGVPVKADGKHAEIKKIGRTLLTILIKGEWISRKIDTSSVRRIVKEPARGSARRSR